MTNDSAPEASAGPPPSVDLQDPLPESTFFYRRVFSYAVSVALLGLLGFVIYQIDEAAELREVALYLCLLLFIVITYYMIAPSAEQVVKMLQTAKLFASGVRMRQESEATSESAHSVTVVEPGGGSDFAPRSRRPRGD